VHYNGDRNMMAFGVISIHWKKERRCQYTAITVNPLLPKGGGASGAPLFFHERQFCFWCYALCFYVFLNR